MPSNEVLSQIGCFVSNNTQRSIDLEKKFSQIKEQTWNLDDYLHELVIQRDQLRSILTGIQLEHGFTDISDELCDIALSLIYLTSLLNIDCSNISQNEEYQKYDVSDLSALDPLCYDLIKAIQEMRGKRFSNVPKEYIDNSERIKDNIIKMYIIIFNYAEENGIDMNKRYRKMCVEATQFVNTKIRGRKHHSLRKLFIPSLETAPAKR